MFDGISLKHKMESANKDDLNINLVPTQQKRICSKAQTCQSVNTICRGHSLSVTQESVKITLTYISY